MGWGKIGSACEHCQKECAVAQHLQERAAGALEVPW